MLIRIANDDDDGDGNCEHGDETHEGDNDDDNSSWHDCNNTHFYNLFCC